MQQNLLGTVHNKAEGVDDRNSYTILPTLNLIAPFCTERTRPYRFTKVQVFILPCHSWAIHVFWQTASTKT